MGFWKPLPYDRFDYRSDLPPAEVLRRLGDAIEPRRWFRAFFGPATRALEGKLDNNAFDVQRIIMYRNSFLPRLRGVVEPHALGGSRISGTMTLLPFVAAFLAIWIGGVGLAGCTIAVAIVKDPTIAAFALVPFGMLLFVWALTTLSFSFEARKARALLEELLQARPVLPGETGFS